jgi:hypothetical protein
MPQDDTQDHGVMVGSFLLTDGMPCSYLPGTYVQVVYTEQDGWREVKHLAPFARSYPLGTDGTRLPSV